MGRHARLLQQDVRRSKEKWEMGDLSPSRSEYHWNPSFATHQLCLSTIRLMDWADDHHIIIRSTFVTGRLNIRADALSRKKQFLKQEWSLV